MLDSEAIDILFFTEIWISELHHDTEITLPGYQSPIIDPNRRGGACVYLRDNIEFTRVIPPYRLQESV